MMDLLSAYRLLNVSLALVSTATAAWVLISGMIVGRMDSITVSLLDYVTNAAIAILVLYMAHIPFYRAIQKSALRAYISAEVSYGLIASALVIVVLTSFRITQYG